MLIDSKITECPVLLASMAKDAMCLEHCNHHISLRAILSILDRAEIVCRPGFPTKGPDYDRLKEALKSKKIICPLCRSRILGVQHAYEYRQLLAKVEQVASIILPPKDGEHAKESISDATITGSSEKELLIKEPTLMIETVYEEESSCQAGASSDVPSGYVNDDQCYRWSNENNLCGMRRIHCLNAEAQARDVLDEYDAFERGDTFGCVKKACIARIRRCAACCLVAPATATNLAFSCAVGCLCYAAWCHPVAVGAHSCCDGEESEQEENCARGFLKAIAPFSYVSILAARLGKNLLCCLPNLCLPELVDKCKVFDVDRRLEKAEQAVSEDIDDISQFMGCNFV